MNPAALKSYFNRIKIEEIQGNSLENLQLLVKHHTMRIPFENLNPLLDIPVKLDLNSLMQKLIFDRRGGYCFEQNLLFMEVLKVLGYEVKPLAARVVSSGETMNARTHMFLLATIEESQFIADVGFGGATPTEPLRLEPGLIQKTPHTTYRITENNEEFSLEYLKDNDWKPLHVFNFQKQFPVDFQMANWYTSTFPTSHFRHQLSVARADEEKRFGLWNNQLSIHHINGKTEKKELSTVKEMMDVLENLFELNLSQLIGLEDRLEEIIEGIKKSSLI